MVESYHLNKWADDGLVYYRNSGYQCHNDYSQETHDGWLAKTETETILMIGYFIACDSLTVRDKPGKGKDGTYPGF